jgi:CubicO group peptidase (beta-lactamase class C family)
MNMKKINSLLFILSFISLYSIGQNNVKLPQAEIDSIDFKIKSFMSKWSVPGSEFTLDYKNTTVYNQVYGFADFGQKVETDNLFRISSDSKIFTAISILQLYEQGKLKLDDKVFGPTGILNQYQHYLDKRLGNVTVFMLLHHRGGWDRENSGDPDFSPITVANIDQLTYSPPPTENTIAYVLDNMWLENEPGTKFAYSNFGYLLLGQIIEKITGQSYSDYVSKNIFTVAGIRDMKMGKTFPDYSAPGNKEVHYFDYPGAPLVSNCFYKTLAEYWADSTKKVPNPYGGFDMDTNSSFAGWIASSNDLVKISEAIPKLLKPGTVLILTTPLKPENYGMALYITDDSWYHTGTMPGSMSEFLHSNQLDCALVLNSRGKDDKGMEKELKALLVNILKSFQP